VQDLKDLRKRLSLSQLRLARISGVSRFNIALAELGDRPLRPDEAAKIDSAIQREAARLSQEIQAIASTQSGKGIPNDPA
jgi:predicted transcriptional regulator